MPYRMIVGLVLLAWSLAATDAEAQYRFCNEAPVSVEVAFGHWEGQWTSEGWWTIESGECKTVYGRELARRKYYYYVRTTTGGFEWKGDYSFCVQRAAFTIRGDNSCAQRGYESLGFRESDVGEARSYVSTITCSTCDSLVTTLNVPSTTKSWTIGDHSVRMRVSGQVKLVMEGDRLAARLTAEADLGDLQRIVPALVQAQLNHNDDCDYVLNMHTVRLTARGTQAMLFAAGHYDEWECPEALGVSLGKHKLFEQNGDVTIGITPYVSGGDVGLSTNVEQVTADGVLGQLLGSDAFGPWLWDVVRDVMPSGVKLATLRDLYPPELRPYQPTLHGVSFVDLGGGRLGLRASASIKVSAGQARILYGRLIAR